VAQVVESLPNMCETLSSKQDPSLGRKKKKKKERKITKQIKATHHPWFILDYGDLIDSKWNLPTHTHTLQRPPRQHP
jgi:hypothetical protein